MIFRQIAVACPVGAGMCFAGLVVGSNRVFCFEQFVYQGFGLEWAMRSPVAQVKEN
jgi:hypothetical protein